jgi:hypothetical protein
MAGRGTPGSSSDQGLSDRFLKRVIHLGERLTPPSLGKLRSRSPSPAPGSSKRYIGYSNPHGGRLLTQAGRPVTPTPVPGPPPTSNTLQPLDQDEIRKRTFSFLKKKLGDRELEELQWDQYTGTTTEQANEAIGGVKCLVEKSNQSRWTKMDKVLQYVESYSKIADVAIQHQPEITALVWAGIRTCIQVCQLHISQLPDLVDATLYLTS